MKTTVYRVTADGETTAELGYDTIDHAMYFSRRRDAEKFVRGCVQAWHDNPPYLADETEDAEYHAIDFRGSYHIESMPLSEAICDMDADDIRAVVACIA